MLKDWIYIDYEVREIYESLELDPDNMDYSSVNITNGRANIPLGAFVFETSNKSKYIKNRQVDYSSKSDFRIEMISALLSICLMKSYKFTSVKSEFRVLKAFDEFMSDKGILCKNHLVEGIEKYFDYLREQVRLNMSDGFLGCRPSTARKTQNILISIAGMILGEDSLPQFYLIKESRSQKCATKPASTEEISQAFTHYTALFEQIKNRLLAFEKFPWKLNMYGVEYYVFPYRGKPVSLGASENQYLDNPGFDYETGCLNSRKKFVKL